MAAMDQLRRLAAIDVEELSGRQTLSSGPSPPKPFSEPEQLQLGGPLPGAGRQDRCALLYPDREIFSDPSAVRSRTAALGIPMVAARNCTNSSCFIGREGVLELRRSADSSRRCEFRYAVGEVF